MKKLITTAVVALTLGGAVAPAFAQPYGGYGGRGYDSDDRGSRYRDRDYDDRRGDSRDRRDDSYDRDRSYGGRRGGYAFDANEYVRCNPDVRKALQRGQLTSAEEHYRVFGRRENRRLSC